MKRSVTWFCCLIAGALGSSAQSPTTSASVRYTLLDGSYFIDDCLVCGRPTILVPLQGTFDLVLLQNTPPVTRYAVQNVNFASSSDFYAAAITGSGTYGRFEEFARVQDMELATVVKTEFTNQIAFFTNGTPIAYQAWPLIQVSLTETNGTLLQTFSMELFAAPVREIWFSTTRPLTNADRIISPGDLVSDHGRVVKRNSDLARLFGIMPPVPDLGLDAVEVTQHGEILFSVTVSFFSETLSYVRHGDLLSSYGRIVKRYEDLLAPFLPMLPVLDAGLDGVQLMPDGHFLFSIQTNTVVQVGTSSTLSNGDILSDRGVVFRTQQQLLANFHPTVTNADFGLDAFRVLPDGEVWFSVEHGFTDINLGAIRPGDVLSDSGYRAFRNSDLVAALKPADTSLDYGLDALFVVTDLSPPQPAPRFLGINPIDATNQMRLCWDGDGAVFELEGAPSLSGPWEPRSPLLPDLSFDDDITTNGNQLFYRLRQW